MSVSGTLVVHVVEARNLTKSDLFSKNDPYCRIRVSGTSTVLQTRNVPNTNSPKWFQELRFPMEKVVIQSCVLYAEVWDMDVGKDDMIGTVEIPLREVRCDAPVSFNHWHHLRGRTGKSSGEIHLEITFQTRGYNGPSAPPSGAYYAPNHGGLYPAPGPAPGSVPPGGYGYGAPPPAQPYCPPPTQGYGQPPPGYGYGQPQTGYAPPPTGYAPTPGGYAPPPGTYPQGYNPPPGSGYGAPPPPAGYGQAPPPYQPGYPAPPPGTYGQAPQPGGYPQYQQPPPGGYHPPPRPY